VTDTDVQAGAPAPPRLRWWREVVYVLAFYGVYSFIRNSFGTDSGAAFDNALRIIDLERFFGTFQEERIQEWFLDDRWFIQFWNLFYGTFHFVVTTFALIWMYVRWPQRYIRWRTALAVMTGAALIGFATFPLMPPRLLPDHFGFVDTLRTYGGLWSFDDDALKRVSNQYAAMPSLHIGWAAWSMCVLWPAMRRPWSKGLVLLYPWLTLFAIVVTANHYWIDALGGVACLLAGYAAGVWWDRRRRGGAAIKLELDDRDDQKAL
jgi:hypothetical protein